ncbi:galactosylceramide sulfotransferase-like [Mizuhopecten yessoensis]|uniref:galactosylceramide sulfotransferase-like n=1 Tax=Mizuhopecten yessoensis TaxID=6573 RepID=UPI000B45936D|nr:galactosylceramide sulfotransferase-like [Mizuhopecten yessoensis]
MPLYKDLHAFYVQCTNYGLSRFSRPPRRIFSYKILPLVILFCMCLILAVLILHITIDLETEETLDDGKEELREVETVQKDDDSGNVEEVIKLESIKDEAKKVFNNRPPELLNNRDCQVNNFVFIKCMKCATETMGTILRRYALKNKLSVLLPRGINIYLGWPYMMESSDYRPSSSSSGNRYYNCLIEHAIYNASVMKSLFPHETRFISIIREPWSHFKSTFHYFNMQKLAHVVSDTPLSTYLQDIQTYEKIYKSPEAASHRYCIPDGFSVTRNLMCHCMGMKTGFPEGAIDISKNTRAVQDFLNWTENEFSLVMIAEYFHESLVLLKRMMCWTMKDIIYKRVNSAKYKYEENDGDRALHERWSRADYQLYNFFNESFWEKVVYQGKTFNQEVQIFTKIQKSVNVFCNFSSESGKIDPMFNMTKTVLSIPQNKFSLGFTFTLEDCELLGSDLLSSLKEQHEEHTQYEDKDPPKRTC